MICKCLSSGLRWIWVSVLVLALDRYTKVWAQKHLIFQQTKAIFPSFNLALSYNRGSAFGFLNHDAGWYAMMFAGIAIAVSIAIIIWLARLNVTQRWLAIGLSLVLGGALGNLWDRFSYGHVIDFIQVYVADLYWPTFNLADSAICIGAVMLMVDAIKKK